MKKMILSLVATIVINMALLAQTSSNIKSCDRSVYGSTADIDGRGPEVPPDNRIILAHFIVDLPNPYQWCDWNISYRLLGGSSKDGKHIEEYQIDATRENRTVRYHLKDVQDAASPWGRTIELYRIDLPDKK